MGNLIIWIALAGLVVVCATATAVAKRFAYGNPRSIGSLAPAEFEARFRRARSAGWTCASAWIFAVVLALWVFWPPTGWLIGFFAGSAVLLVAILIGLDDPRAVEVEEYFDE
jgi:hypothetical protein